MTSAIVGYTGFVGSNLLQFYPFDFFYNSSNFHEAKNKEFDTLYFCGVPAVKWYANKNPEEDSTIIQNIQSILGTIKVKKIILISTIDVYECTNSTHNENYSCDFAMNHTYGRNRYLFEQFVQTHFENYHIIRLPALFGKGLKKNIIYDLIRNNQIENIEKNTKFQWYDLNWLKQDIDVVIAHNIRVCNLFTEPLETLDILTLFDYPLDSYKSQSTMTYNLTTKYSELFNSSINGYVRDKNTVLESIQQYLQFNKIDKSNLVVSNICVKHVSQFQFSCILKLFGIKNVQIAPTTLIGSWDNLDTLNFDIYSKNNINVYSFQSITYGLLYNIFDVTTQHLLLTHLKKVIDCGIQNNIKVFVFGCPKNRHILNDATNDNIFVDFFRVIGDYIGDNDLTICIENNSKQYGCNYLNTISEVGDIVTKINHRNVKMMVDIGNVMMEHDNINDMYNYKDIIYNIDIANPNMKPFIQSENQHNKFTQILKNIKYDKKMNLEMIINGTNSLEELNILSKSLNHFVDFII
uniref:Xylose isomerase-like TIM barrel domain-containing protein n=1 Tax=viral metagenome TaxID=1070528 RepID=A0A6C0BAN6_9ZZZZ